MEDLEEIVFCVRRAYQPDELVRLERGFAAGVFSDPADVMLVAEVGVPRVEELALSFNLIHRAPHLRDLAAGKFDYDPTWPTDLRGLSETYDFVLGIDKTNADAFVSLDLTGKHKLLRINSKLRFFVAFLAERQLHFQRRQLGSHSFAASMELSMGWIDRIDPGASQGEWWQAIFEDIKLYD